MLNGGIVLTVHWNNRTELIQTASARPKTQSSERYGMCRAVLNLFFFNDTEFFVENVHADVVE